MAATSANPIHPMHTEPIANHTPTASLDAWFQQGLALHRQGRTDEAKALYEQILAAEPRHADALHLQGVIAAQSNNPALAETLIAQAIAINPNKAAFHTNLGLALKALHRLDEALVHFDKAIALHPDSAEAHSNRGLALHELARTQEALAAFEQAIAIQPDYADAHVNRGWSLFVLRRFAPAIASFDKALAIQPGNAQAAYNKALAMLITGQYEQGWALHEWRWKTNSLISHQRHLPFPLWQGQDSLTGKSILLHAELGFGDSIQFARYARLVKNLGAHVTLEVPKPLLALFERLPGVDVLIETGYPLSAFDYHCPLMSLPLAFGTTLTSIPDAAGYLTADPQKVRVWQERLGAKTRPRIGVVWSGGSRPNQPELRSVNERRNVDLQLFASALRDIHADFYSLQKGDPAESQIRGHELDYWPHGNFHNHAHALNDYADTAALIENLDLVVSVDTSTAHLAAALGKPTWILNRYDSCWRWLLERDDSPWYASVKLYRQDESQRWEPVLQRLAQDLKV